MKYIANKKTKKIFNGIIPKYNKNLIYSTEEEVIGTWIDGKPLYRKIFSLTTSNITLDSGAEYKTTNLLPLNYSSNIMIDKSHTYIKRISGMNMYDVTQSLNENYSCSFRGVTNNAEVYIFIGNNIYNSASNIIITLEYTKTTDMITN